jgi:hypothetical protein
MGCARRFLLVYDLPFRKSEFCFSHSNLYPVSRTVIIRAAWGREENLTPLNKVTASALAGLPPGALLGLTRKCGVHIRLPQRVLNQAQVRGRSRLL